MLRFSAADVGLAAAISSARSPARFISAGSPTAGAAKSCSSSRSRVYLTATAATAFSWNIWSFFFFRLLTGAGIGGEYSAINSTIQELIPARLSRPHRSCDQRQFLGRRGDRRARSVVLLDPPIFRRHRLARLRSSSARCSALVILFMRMWIPESPRWLAIHGREEEAERDVVDIEKRILAGGGTHRQHPLTKITRHRAYPHAPRQVFDQLFRVHRTRSLVALALMSAQAFF